MLELLDQIKQGANSRLQNAKTAQDLEEARVFYLGKKGEVTLLMKKLGSLDQQDRPAFGAKINMLRSFVESEIQKKKVALEELELTKSLESDKIDVTIPGRRKGLGNLHPLTKVKNEIFEFFLGMGFSIAEGPEIEKVYYNFQALNIDGDHPARDEQDTFYITDQIILRTQTSPMQVRVMENSKPPIRIISPGRVYRPDAVDATHAPVFNQIEGLVVDKGITFAHLKGLLEEFTQFLYGVDAKVRFRPHHFPFTEPSAEMDVSCFICKGDGCSVCKGEGFIEILGCGMVHPKVLSSAGIDPSVYSGFAFGLGLERMVMRKYEIQDLRLFYENDIRFLNQF